MAPPRVIFARSQIRSPAGTAIITALPRTKTVLSSMERTITRGIFGLRYGGISRIKDDGLPCRMVDERSLDAMSVNITPSSITAARMSAQTTEGSPVPAEKNTVITVTRAGKRPLHGMKAFVSMAMRRSFSESIILAPTTPAALQPSPMHMVSDCLPQEPQAAKHLSRLYAILGRYPISSSRVKSGKNIAIGGSMTATIHASVRYMPKMSMLMSHSAASTAVSARCSTPSNLPKRDESASDG